MSRISEEDIQNIRSKARIEEVIGKYLPITRGGRSLKAVCPFHDDHDPSMMISPDKQIFKCFVCGEGGNVFQFVQKYKKISFNEAVREVAAMVGYELPEEEHREAHQADARYKRLYELLDTVIKYSQYQLNNAANQSVRDYVLARGITAEQIQEFQLGYLPDRRLSEFLQKKGFTDNEIIRSGMAVLGEQGLSDLFCQRLTIPIHDQYGNPIGFTARTMSSDPRKYINTQQTEIYTKGSVLFSYHRAKEECRRQHAAVVVEGPMDLMALARAGITNVVASLGTAVTKEQLEQLKKLANRVIFCYDGDKPGQNADFKGAKLASQLGLKAEVADNDTGLDPDEIDRQLGPVKNRDILAKPQGWLDFASRHLKGLYDPDTYAGRTDYAKAMTECINTSSDRFEREFFQKKLLQETGLSPEQLKSFGEVPIINRPPAAKPRYDTAADGRLLAQYEVISQLTKSYAGLEVFQKELGFLPDDRCQKIIIYLTEYYRTHSQVSVADLLDYLPDEGLKAILVDITGSELLAREYDRRVLGDAIQKIRDELLAEESDRVRNEIRRAADPAQKAALARKYEELIKKRKRGGSQR